MMKISRIKKHDTVLFRCGGRLTVRDAKQYYDGVPRTYTCLTFNETDDILNYTHDSNGNYNIEGGGTSMFDIIEVKVHKVKLEGEIWFIIAGIGEDNCVAFETTLAKAVALAKGYYLKDQLIALTNKMTWTQGDGFELVKEEKMLTNTLCIGGVCDGETRIMRDEDRTMQIPHKIKLTLIPPYLTPPKIEPEVGITTYNKLPLSWGGNEYTIWLEANINPADLLGILLAGYRKPKS